MALTPKPIKYSTKVSSEGGVASPKGENNMSRARVLLWADLKQSSKNPSLMSYIRRRNNFRPYVFTPQGIHKVQLFEEVSAEIIVAPRVWWFL